MKRTRSGIWLSIWLLQAAGLFAQVQTGITSPDKQLRVDISLDKEIVFTVSRGGEQLLVSSPIALETVGGEVLGQSPRLASKKTRTAKEHIVSPFYRCESFDTEYTELNLKFKGDYGIVFRAYNEGVAYRFYTTRKGELEIRNERAGFSFDKDYQVFLPHSTNPKEPFAMAFQNIYQTTPLSKADTLLAFLPATVDYGNGTKLTLLESDLETYPGMFLQAGKGTNSLQGVFAPYPARTDRNRWRFQEYITERDTKIAKVNGNRSFPWRIMAVTTEDRQMPVNHLVYALASPNRIGDTSWIKPGKSAWEWWNDWGVYGVDFKTGINTETYKYYIDFASRYGLEYVIFDEGWYVPASGDMMTVIPGLDLPGLIEYARTKGVGVILWTVFNVLDAQLEEACAHYASLGVKGFKVDFLDRDDQKAVEMVYRLSEAAARHHLMLDLHGIYKPTGLNRTYPNVVNFEGVFGMEEAKWSTIEKDMPLYDVTFPFIRMMAGPVDFTPGAMRNGTKRDFKPIYNNPMSQGTRCHQLATYVVYDSPFTMLCDAPTMYQQDERYTRFLASIPVETEQTKILSGQMGEYIVTARRKGDVWHVGGLTNWTPRSVTVDCSFLTPGKAYNVTLFKDGVNADKQAADYAVEELTVCSTSQLTIQLAVGGGFAMRITETLDTAVSPTSVPASLNLFPFYTKYVDAGGIPVVSSDKVRDEALIRAAKVITQMLSGNEKMRRKLVEKGAKVMIIGEKEDVCDLPEYAHICDTPEHIAFWNRRARGFGGSPEHDLSASCGEENVLGLSGDRYYGESILVHEFAHIIHMVGIVGIQPGFDDQLEALRLKAIEKGLWDKTYAISNKEEYFAETVQSFFNCNRFADPGNGVHNAINTREKLQLYDPDMYALLLNYFNETDLDLVDANQKGW